MSAGRVKALALAAGASEAGIVRAGDNPEYGRFLEASAAQPGGLAYLNRDPQKRKNVSNWYAGARSVLVCAFRYWTPEMDYPAALAAAGDPAAFLARTGRREYQPELLRPGARISRYALCPDYHQVVKGALAGIFGAIRGEFPLAEGKFFCDTSPVLEKELARLAGLGFRGKNTLAVSERLGSYFFIGGIALNLDLEPDQPALGGCGGCSLCERACPTGALKGGRLSAGLCLSYWTTQAKEKMPEELAAKAGGRAYGCDACQEACPYNAVPGAAAPGFKPVF
jgi:epoxyqueuosine reductase